MKLNTNLSDVILENVDIVNVISDYVSLQQSGKNHKGLCPFHSEKTPSFTVSDDKQLYHCFGCGAAGNVIGFIMKIENLDFLDAIELLADKNNISIDEYKYSNNSNTSNNNISRDDKNRLLDIMRNSARYFYSNLQGDDRAKNYILNRGLDQSIIKKFGLGYAKTEWDGLLKKFNNKNIEELQKVGLIINRKDNSGYYDRFRDRIIFPIIDIRGKIIGFGGRVLDDSLPKYLNSPETILFNKSKTLYGLNIAKDYISESNNTIIVTEGYMDVISLHNMGIKNVVATLGTALTKEHGKMLERYAKTVVICYDSDNAGIKATIRSVEVLKDIKSNIRVLELTDGLDPDEYIKKYGKVKFLALLSSAKSGFLYTLENLSKDYDLANDDEQLKFINKSIEIFGDLSDKLRVEYFIKSLSNIPNLDQTYIKTIVSDITKKNYTNYNLTENKTRITKRRKPEDILEERLMYLSFISKDNCRMIFEKMSVESFTNQILKDYMFLFKEGYGKKNKLDIVDFTDKLDIEKLTLLEKLIHRAVLSKNPSREINEIISKHKMLGIEKSIMEIRKEREKYFKLLNSNIIESKNEITNLCSTLTKTEKNLQHELLRIKSNWQTQKGVE